MRKMLNNVILMGRICHDLDLKGTQNGKNFLRFVVAVNRKYSKEKEKPPADFIDCVAWDGTAKFIYKHWNKGDLIAICGGLQVNSFVDKKTGEKRKSTSVWVRESSFCGGNKQEKHFTAKKIDKTDDFFDDDVLF
jgi:single-strand DNA-binding protein